MKRSYLIPLITSLLILSGGAQLLGCGSSSDIEILSRKGYYVTGTMVGNYVEIFGELQNTGNKNLRLIKLTATLYDSDGKEMGTDYSYAYTDILLPGDKAPFSIMLGPTGRDYESYTLEVTSYKETTEEPYRDFEFLNTSSYINDNGYYCVKGEIKNTDSQNIDSVAVIITFYNAEGKVISATSHLKKDLEAGGIVSFDTWTLPDWISSDIANYSLQTDVSD